MRPRDGSFKYPAAVNSIGGITLPKGDRYKCDVCGMVVLVEDACGCSACDLVCCEKPMKKAVAKPGTAKAKKK
jgi:hypothetical protein